MSEYNRLRELAKLIEEANTQSATSPEERQTMSLLRLFRDVQLEEEK